jgi:putative flavoprotein involved in K+ transport
LAATPPQVSGAGGGRTVSYQQLANAGATLLGRVVGANRRGVELAADLGANIRFADDASAAFRSRWDRHAASTHGTIGPAAIDPADAPAEHLYELTGPPSLDFADAGIRTVIWATGFGPSTAWLPDGALDERGRPQLPGLHAIGASWLTHRSSANLYGIAADADRLAARFAVVTAAAA